jgi:biopolymer transport protein ExbB
MHDRIFSGASLLLKRLPLIGIVAGALALSGCGDKEGGWWQKDWPYRSPVTIDTTSTGTNISGPIGRMPVLVRLHSGNFSFGESADNGADLRIVAGDNKTPLTFHIESFDILLGVANVWVDVPRLAGGEKAPVWVYHGNKSAPALVNTAGTFDANFNLVLHYDEAIGTPTADKTSFKNNPTNGPTSVDEGAIIGRGGKFAASTGMIIPASPSLATPATGFTFSTWVKLDALGTDQALFDRDGVVIGLAAGVPYVAAGARILATAAMTAGQWTHVAVTSDGKATRLFVGGREVATGAALPAMAGPVSIGGSATLPFSGGLDETRLSKVARPANVIATDAAGQGPEGKLLSFGKDEEQGSGGGTVLFILKATPLLDWFIIGLCVLLLVGAIIVMIMKNNYLAGANRGNKAFMKRFRTMEEDLIQIAELPGLSPGERKLIATAPLARLYETGIDELRMRQKRLGDRPLSGEAVEALRSAVDAEQVAENQKLDVGMVLLTIAISGGPFIGLLGTVMGVMNTFGGVAMAGDVNVNAIAPGIAAALLATIAGLAAAIPSLFGYNYLNSKITAMADEMRVFCDRLVTRLAEVQAERSHTAPPTRLAAE